MKIGDQNIPFHPELDMVVLGYLADSGFPVLSEEHLKLIFDGLEECGAIERVKCLAYLDAPTVSWFVTNNLHRFKSLELFLYVPSIHCIHAYKGSKSAQDQQLSFQEWSTDASRLRSYWAFRELPKDKIPRVEVVGSHELGEFKRSIDGDGLIWCYSS